MTLLLLLPLFFHIAPHEREAIVTKEKERVGIILHVHISHPWRAKFLRGAADKNRNNKFELEEIESLQKTVLHTYFFSLKLFQPAPFFFQKPEKARCEPLDEPSSEYPFECRFVFFFSRENFPYGFARLTSSVSLNMPLTVAGTKQFFLFQRARNFFLP